MSALQRVPVAVLTLALAAVVGAAAWWLVTNKPEEKKAEKPPPGAKVDKVVKEEDLSKVTASEKGAERIGLTVGAVAAKSVRRSRVYGGEVMVADGRRIPVTASMAGNLAAPVGTPLSAGLPVKAGDTLYQLLPLLSPESRITMVGTLATAEGSVKTAEKRVDAARVARNRAKSAADFSGNKAALEAAEEAVKVAEQELDAARVNHAALKKAAGELDKGTASPLPVIAPISGIVRVVSALPGQTVANGAALCEVVDLSEVWVRLPLPVGDADSLLPDAAVSVGRLAGRPVKPVPEKPLPQATPIPAPPSANLLAGTIDLYYKLSNPKGEFRPGERVGVTVPLNDPETSLTVPWSAVVLDIHGGYWVFEETAPRTFYRRRVVVAYTDPTDLKTAVLKYDAEDRARAIANGMPELKAGTRIALTGVQELFGAETGFVK